MCLMETSVIQPLHLLLLLLLLFEQKQLISHMRSIFSLSDRLQKRCFYISYVLCF